MKLIKATLAFNLLVISSIYSITKKWEAGDNLAIKFQSSTNFQLPEEERVQIAAHVPGFKDKIKENYTQSLVINHIYIHLRGEIIFQKISFTSFTELRGYNG